MDRSSDLSRLSDEEMPGVRLRAAREEQELTTKEIAGRLRVDVWILDALERDEYSALGAPVFAKGHLRKYAVTLGLDPDELMVAYYQLAGTREAPPLIAESILRVEAAQRPSFSWLLPSTVVLAGIASVAAAGFWFVGSDVRSRTASATMASPVSNNDVGDAQERSSRLSLPTVVTPEPAGDQSLNDNHTESDAAPPVASTEDVAEPTASSAPDVQPQLDTIPPAQIETQVERATTVAAVAAPVTSIDPLTITLRFRNESWVEVYDADRRKLLYGLGEEGSVQYLSGTPPLRVFLGRQSGVDVEVNGRAYAIPSDATRGNTARFSISASD